MSKDTISLVALFFSAISLIPVLYSYFRRYVAKLDVFDKGFVIVGFSSLGSLISVPLTLRSWHFDLFISQMTLRLTNTTTLANRDLEMALFRQETLVSKASVDGKQQTSTDGQIEMARPILLYEKSPRFIDIVFSNSAERVRVASEVESLKMIVNETLFAHSKGIKSGQPDLASDPRFLAGRAKIRQEFFWAAGEYLAKIEVVTHRPTRTFNFKFRFSLSDTDVELLKSNDTAIVAEGLGIGSPAYATRYPRITKIE